MKNLLKAKIKGFTLIELLVVIAVIGLLSMLAVAALNSARKRAADAKVIGDVKQIMTALEMYRENNTNKYYPNQSNLVLGQVYGTNNAYFSCLTKNGFVNTNGTSGVTTCDAPIFMAKIPEHAMKDTSLRRIFYNRNANPPTNYYIRFSLWRDSGNFKAGVNYILGNGAITQSVPVAPW